MKTVGFKDPKPKEEEVGEKKEEKGKKKPKREFKFKNTALDKHKQAVKKMFKRGKLLKHSHASFIHDYHSQSTPLPNIDR